MEDYVLHSNHPKLYISQKSKYCNIHNYKNKKISCSIPAFHVHEGCVLDVEL